MKQNIDLADFAMSLDIGSLLTLPNDVDSLDKFNDDE